MLKGIDIYNADGRPDFAAVKASGIQYIIHKATEGVNFADASFAANVTAARAAGLPVGAYHYITATPIDQQAHDFLAAIGGHGPYCCLAIDVEGRISSLGRAAITDRILTLYKAIRAAGYTCPVYVYASASWLRSLIDVDACRSAGLLIWMAAYSSDTPDNTDRSADCDMWQYSDKGSVPGISRAVDMDVCYRGIGTGSAPTVPAKAAAATGNATIRTAQQFYNARGAGLTVDGIWGPATRKAAIMSVQRGCNQAYRSGLTVDGIWGPKTAAAVRTLRRGNNNAAVWSLQAALMARGYGVGSSGIDGKYGSGTEAAVRTFQRAAGLTVDGLAGKKTFEKLCG
jgi:GH25 family lysozyme M1 (1,4-beta-N-acetylmuramidase)